MSMDDSEVPGDFVMSPEFSGGLNNYLEVSLQYRSNDVSESHFSIFLEVSKRCLGRFSQVELRSLDVSGGL